MSEPSRFRRLCLLLPVPPVWLEYGEPCARCARLRQSLGRVPRIGSGLSLGAPLARIKTNVQGGGKTITVVALGSQSTTGFGMLRSGGAFPDIMKQELLQLGPAAQIELIDRGRIMDNIPGNVARLDSDVLRHKPDLVVCAAVSEAIQSVARHY